MRTFLLAILAAVFLRAGALAADARPNILILLADDQGWGDLSLNGNKNLRTPYIDSLAKDGARFEPLFVQPVCSPTRAELLTGRWHPRGGVHGVSTGAERLDLDERTIAEAFRTAGYATGCFGKWHNGCQYPYHPNGRGFEEYYGFTSGHWGEYFDPPLDHNGRPVRVGSVVELSLDKAKWTGTIAEEHDPPLRGKEQDRVPRRGESYVKDFRPLSLGILELPAGKGTLTLRATKVAGAQVADVRAVELVLKK